MGLENKHKPFFILFAALATFYAGSKPPSPPVVVEEGIKVTTFESDASGATIGWETTDERIVIGEDVFVVQFKERQIPRIGGYSQWQTLGETTNTLFTSKEFLRNRDILVRIVVDKGVAADEE